MLYWVICHPLTYPAWKNLQYQSTLCSGHACALCTLNHRVGFLRHSVAHVHPEIPCQSKRDGVKPTYAPSTLWRIFQ